jgi:hypothetical protein
MAQNTCSVTFNLLVDANRKTALVLCKTTIDGKDVFTHIDSTFRGGKDELMKVLDSALSIVEKDKRFGT